MQPKWVRVIFLTVNFYCYSKIKWMRMCSIIIEQAKVFLLLSVRVSTPYIAIVSFCNLEMVYQIRNRGDKSKKKKTNYTIFFLPLWTAYVCNGKFSHLECTIKTVAAAAASSKRMSKMKLSQNECDARFAKSWPRVVTIYYRYFAFIGFSFENHPVNLFIEWKKKHRVALMECPMASMSHSVKGSRI